MIRAVLPGTFDPTHYGQIDIALRAARIFDEVVVAVYDKPLKNLIFSPNERIHLAKVSFLKKRKIRVMGFSGLTVDFCKEIHAQVIVRGLRVFSDFEYEFRIALANKRLSDDIDAVALITREEHTFLSSTTVKEIAALHGDVSTMVPPHVNRALKAKFEKLVENQEIVDTTSLRD
jgi:pantetheine-phosphate adenylyltransferase